MEKLIITNCAADTSMHEGVPATLGDSNVLAAEVEKGHAAGAAIAHIHAPPTDYDAWANHTKAIRDRCDVMIQYGISTQTVEQRKAVIANRPGRTHGFLQAYLSEPTPPMPHVPLSKRDIDKVIAYIRSFAD